MPRIRSNIWKCFQVYVGDDVLDQSKAECQHCEKTSKARLISRGKSSKTFSTKPLWNHLKMKHLKVTDILLRVNNIKPGGSRANQVVINKYYSSATNININYSLCDDSFGNFAQTGITLL